MKEQLRSLVDGLDEGQAAEVDFAERSEEILRDELGRTA